MSSSIQLNIFWKSRTLSLMQSGLMFVNTLLIIVTIHSHLGAGAELFPDKPLPKAIQDSGGESSSDFLDNALSPNYLVASSSDDASSRYLDPTDSTNQKNSLLVNENSLSINTGDGCSSYHSQMNSKRMRRWDCGPDLPPNCCPPPASTPEKQSHPLENQQPPKSTNQEESDHEDPSPKPVDNPLDNKKPFPLKKNEDICPFSSFGMRNLPVCDSGDPDQATWHRGSGPPGYYILDDCFPFIPLFGCWWNPSNVWCCVDVIIDTKMSQRLNRPYYVGWYCLLANEALPSPRNRFPTSPQPAPGILPGPL